MVFWGLEIKPGKPTPYVPPPEQLKLRVSQATLGEKVKPNERVCVKCHTSEGEDFLLCSLTAGRQECCFLDLVFSGYAEFSVTGSSTVHLTGYLMPEFEGGPEEDEEDSEDDMMMMDGDMGDMGDDSDDDSDEEEDHTLQCHDSRGRCKKSCVVIEEIPDDDVAKSKKGASTPKNVKMVKGLIESKEEEDDEDDEDDDDESEEEAPPKPQSKKKAAGQPLSQQKRKFDEPPSKAAPEFKKGKQTETPTQTPSKSPGLDPSKASGTPTRPHVKMFPNGLEVHTVQMGKPGGKEALPGKNVVMNYTGKLKANGKVFDSTKGKKPFTFRLGVGDVIKGWDVGVKGMRVGDKRTLVIPPDMGYGRQGVRGAIPPNATLEFDVELVAVK
mmetsp:Transcript_28351/g.39162  ORF Transcript_28351/g.39162 Transcript_28351/m.39162 type:complete len:384 (-) Transcript_28351:91-1242(-)|eukprot:CAMPEP_0196579938 /NCGR_PEP_ID=MMETSP1081-20130531/25841_1 /TAXON_ID=36882 /ORGANISM="Pyramimonas amylifera, Strain CCMP720" /LENGTH=383 /DNA_ID=CAMNT_0041899667 /DNA_START=121 /DNA_END=1272 /DNA_ORIENTATION=+